LNAISTWLPLIVKELSGNASAAAASLLTSIPAVFACAGMLILGRLSDRAGSRRVYTLVPLLIAATGWLMAGYGTDPIFRFVGLILTTTSVYSAVVVFWAIPANHLSTVARPAGLAVIAMAGIMGSIVSPAVIGFLRDFTGSFTAGLVFAAALLVVGASLLGLTRSHEAPRPSEIDTNL
jgi:ACS family 4-hydroxyphenylacetate permease-like MFS transporter